MRATLTFNGLKMNFGDHTYEFLTTLLAVVFWKNPTQLVLIRALEDLLIVALFVLSLYSVV